MLRHQVTQLVNMPAGAFVAMGDANSDVTQQTTPLAVGHAPPGATHQGGGALDGAIASPHLAANVSNVGMRAGDHAGIQGRFQ